MSGFDDLERDLFARVSTLAAERRNTPRRRFVPRSTLALTGIVGLLGLSGVAVAAQSWWQPTIGRPGHPTQFAAQDPPSAAVLDALAILRRPQTAADRGSAARFALTLSDGQRFVRTDFVRQLGVEVRGEPVVLVPTGERRKARRSDELCLWVAANGSTGRSPSAGSTCGTLADLRAGRLTIAVGARLDPAQEARRAANRRRQIAEAEARGQSTRNGMTFHGETYTREETKLTFVGLAPDGANVVRFGHRRVPVEGNAFAAYLDERELPHRIRFGR